MESFVLRVIPAQVATGRLVGEVECVATGERSSFKDSAQLVQFCQRQLHSDLAQSAASGTRRIDLVSREDS